jgi:hypothetical protein
MVRTQVVLLGAALLATAIPAAAQTGRMSPADNEASAMGNCFDRRLGVSRSAMDGPVGSSHPAPSAGGGGSAPSSAPPAGGNAGAPDGNAAPSAAGNPASPSSLPDCK